MAHFFTFKQVSQKFYENNFFFWKKLEKLYFKDGERISNSYYLPKEIRYNLMKKVRNICDKFCITFASCREGFYELNTSKSCDGSHLIKT